MDKIQKEKERFIAQYYGQQVAVNTLNPKTVGFVYVQLHDIKYLVLRPLSKLKDEDAIEIGKLLGHTPTITRPEFVAKTKGKSFVEYIGYEGLVCDPNTTISIFGYLQSKGYALPWMNYSVEGLKALGWIKLL